MEKKKIKALKQATASSRYGLPILKQVRVLDGVAMATDLEVAVMVKVELPDGMYAISPTDELVKVEGDVADFPEVPEETEMEMAKLNLKSLGEIVPLVSKDTTRPALNLVRVKDGLAMATDGYVAGCRKQAGDFWLAPKVYKIMNGLKGDWVVGVGEHKQLFTNGDVRIYAKKIDMPYPDMPPIMVAKNSKTEVEIDNIKKGMRFSLDGLFVGIETGDDVWTRTTTYEGTPSEYVGQFENVIMPMTGHGADGLGYLDGELLARFKAKKIKLTIGDKGTPVGVELL